MADHDTAQQHPDPRWILASPGIPSSTDPASTADNATETAEQRMERLRSLEKEEWARIEELGPPEEEMAQLRVPPPVDMFKEDWSKP